MNKTKTEAHYDYLDPLDHPAKLEKAIEHGSAQRVLNFSKLEKTNSKHISNFR
jgi:hypothetical protein